MANKLGAKGWLGFKKETIPGTYEATVDKFFLTEEFEIKAAPKPVEIKATATQLGTLPSPGVVLEPSGSAKILLSANTPHPLYWVLGGTVNTTQPTTGVYRHTFKEGTPISLTAEGYNPAYSRKQAGALLNSLKLGCKAGEPVKCEIEWLALKVDTNPTITSIPSFATEVLTFAGGTVTVAGSAVSDIEELELEINANVEQRHAIYATTGNAPAAVGQKDIFEIKGKFKQLNYSATEFNRLLNANTFAIVLLFEGSEITTGYKRYVKVTLPAAQYTGGFEDAISSEVIEAECEFKAALDVVTSKLIEVELQNTLANLN